MMDCLSGQLLVASTVTTDPVIDRSVCLLVHDDEDGAIGVMLNRPLQPNPTELLALLESEPEGNANRLSHLSGASESAEGPDQERPTTASAVHFGGPLSGPVVAIHTSSEHAEAETGHGIYVAAQKQHLEKIVRDRPTPYRLIVGHLGWSAEKLREEIAAGYWHVLPATAEIVFSVDGEMWPRLIRRATASSVAAWIGTHDVPGAHELN